jgi:methylenetetrahydrofolate reductase (NADPH)
MADTDRHPVIASLAQPRFEIIPMKGVEQQLPYLPADAIVTVTSSPGRGTDATLALATRLADRGGFHVVPHIAARLIRDRVQLKGVLQHLADLEIDEIFVVAGDAPTPAGPFEGAIDLLRAMADIGHDLRIGVTGYPESHAFISDDTTIQAMTDKQWFASYIVSQICFDPRVTAGWIAAVRARGTHLPIHIGVPGAVDLAKLVRVSLRVGIGESLRFARKQSGAVANLVGGYRPDHLVDGLASTVADPDMNVAGWHLFTFNDIRSTEAWRQQVLARYAKITA